MYDIDVRNSEGYLLPAWLNVLRHADQIAEDNNSSGFLELEIILQSYNCQLMEKCMTSINFLRFNNQYDYTEFMLRWS